ncbi:MAG: AAA family ATPase [Candidatus Moranbacteria bacterium CG_4_9_14_3_um_filter_40_7]|nr:MAG: AAA family ATPase [Candidatus Moranbacteria bacterium CG23_combo_of_CG06-09_8_20_14_all_40_16]PIU80452.1 MAG: AAA family ATPase [Candidatus Moranbacteria bacterium CG06_land_8_20_14_3_00_40_12]PJA87954.1 MAG: AAA family ATPase [Candidatus Moranbacteria bacterium CG_4_9_14_3_um_filter_40_7]
MDLMENNFAQNAPLADIIRPQSLEEVFGQEELLGKEAFLGQAIRQDRVPSLIFWGPPGSGKTTLAFIIAKETKSDFLNLSAVSSGKKDLLKIIERAKENKKISRKTVLFIDEIHRWNKAQQDALLPQVENGTLTLIGATTENPSFEVISALLSRVRVFVLQRLEEENIEKILRRALQKTQKKVKADVLKMIARFSNGDARMAINTLEACLNQKVEVTEELVKKVLQKSHLLYDKSGEEHYNIISALHKSMRGGNADAAVYWLARMIEGGEDPLYIARRLVRFASEDVGLANNTALLLANAVFDACHKLGYPECNVHLAQCVIYLAKSQKSVAAYLAYGKAKEDVEKWGNLPVPLPIRSAPTKLMKDLQYGKGYKYTPLEDSSNQEYLPKELKNKKYL